MATFRPLEDRVLIKMIESENKTKGGLHLPEVAQETPSTGIVIAVGPGKRLSSGKMITTKIIAGDRVVFAKFSGTEIHVMGEKHLVIRESELLGIIKKAV